MHLLGSVVAALACSFAFSLALATQPDSAVAPGAAGAAVRTDADVDLALRIDAIVAEALARPDAVGFSVAIARGEEIVLAKGYGLAEAEHGVAANAETLFRIGSITKQFTAAAVLRLAEQEKLDLDDPITKHLPHFPTGEYTVTLRQLLNHTSGVKCYTSDFEFMTRGTAFDLTDDEIVARIDGEPFDFAPGERWSYCNSGYFLLGLVVEKASGKEYAAYLEDEFFEPLGLARSRYDSSSEVIANRAQGYTIVDGALHNDAPFAMSIPGGAGGLACSAADLVRWQIALSRGRVVREASFAAMTTPTVLADGRPIDYGLGLQVGDFRGHPFVGHGGGINGFNSLLRWFREDDLHVAVISNSESVSSLELLERIAEAALDLAPEEIADLELSEEQLARYLGNYRLADDTLDVRVFVEGGKLMLQATDQDAFRLLAQGAHEFRAEFDTSVKIVFEAAGERSASFTLYQGGGTVLALRVP
jgi:CubicO group peptidase (beta-lactamase class C family)